MGECVICLGADPPPVQSGCACRGEAGLAHAACLVAKARAQRATRGDDAWTICQTCTQELGGAVRLALAEAWCAEEPASTAARAWMGMTLVQNGRYADAERIDRGVVAERRAALGDEHPLTLQSMGNLAIALADQDRHEDAVAITRAILRTQGAVRARYVGTPYEPLLAALYVSARSNLACYLRERGRCAEAAGIMRGVVRERVLDFGAGHAVTLHAKRNLAMALAGQGAFGEAEALFREAAAQTQRLLGEEHRTTQACLCNLASTCLMPQGLYAEAESIQRAVLSAEHRTIGEEHPHALTTAHNLGISVWEQGRREEARALVRRVHEASVRVHGPSHRATASVARTLEWFSEPPCAASACARTVPDASASACARCGARIYCSRACRLADARAHKRACTRA